MIKQFVAGLFLLFVLFYSNTDSLAQKSGKKSQNVKVADTYYDNQEYYLAADYYKKELEENKSNAYATYRLAECYRKYYDYDNAEKMYLKASKMDKQQFPLSRFWYSMMLKSNGKYELAKFEFDGFLNEFRALTPEDKRIEREAVLERDGCILVLKELKKPVRNYDFQNLPGPVNTERSEYAPNFYEGDSSIVFASAREGTKGKEKDTRLGEEYSDIFRFQLKGRRWVQYPDDDNFNVINTIRNDGAGTFNKARNKFYYTSCIEEDYPCAIYVSKLVEGQWTEGERLNDNINYLGYECKQPTLTVGGDTMIFVSDRPDGKGLNDLWFSIKTGEEDWQPAMNMGMVNTEYQDIAPFYDDADKTLFFASNGRQGFGGLDIFKAQGSRLDKVSNMGLPFNTNRDEFYVVLGKEKGMIASNREGGKGNDDIYYFNIESSELLLAEISKEDLAKADNFALITNLKYEPGGDPAPDIPVQLTDENGNVILRANSDELGSLKFEDLSPDKTYKLVLENNDENVYADIVYQGSNGEFDLNAQRDGNVLATVTREIIEQFNSMAILSKISYDGSGDPAADVPILLVDENGIVLKKGKTNLDGLARFESLDSDKNYRILIDEDDPRMTADVQFLIDEVTVKWMKQQEEAAAETGKTAEPGKVVFENIYFDFNQSSIRSEARKTLDEIAAYLKENPEVQVEINANTDNIGSDKANKVLAERRGNSVVSYLENKGVDKSALVVHAIGSASPIASNETPVGRQLNRRVEFYIVGGKGYDSHVMTYILEPKKSIEDVAGDFGMSPEELKNLNDLSSEADLRAFVPLRVRRTGDNGLVAPVSMASSASTKYKGLADPGASKAPVIKKSKVRGPLPSLQPGQKHHIVEALETVGSISATYGMSIDELKSLNNLSNNILQIGQPLVVVDNSSKLPTGPGTYVVKEGDTLYDIAKAHGVSVRQIMDWNQMSSPVLYKTMVLKVSAE